MKKTFYLSFLFLGLMINSASGAIINLDANVMNNI